MARLEAAIALGTETVPVIILDGLTTEQVAALRIAYNKISSMSKWDEDLLRAEPELLDAAGFDKELTGLDVHKINGNDIS